MSNEDVIASVTGDQDGQTNEAGVGQDEGTSQQESSTEDWETQAKYHQSEKDKLYAENQELKAGIQEFLDSRESGQPQAPERIALKPDEFDPWEAYNDPSSKSYQFRMQEMQSAINNGIENAVGGIKQEQGRSNLRADLFNHGLNEQEVDSFFEFADKHPSEYGLDNVLIMWRAVTQAPETTNNNPLDKIRQNQANPQPAGILQGHEPERKTETDEMWDRVMSAGNRSNVLK